MFLLQMNEYLYRAYILNAYIHLYTTNVYIHHSHSMLRDIRRYYLVDQQQEIL